MIQLIHKLNYEKSGVMAKETQKAKIERVERELLERDNKIKDLYKLIDENIATICDMQNKADKEFANSPHRKQLEEKLFIAETKLRQAHDKTNMFESRIAAREKEIQELKSEKKNTKNDRGAGRKAKLEDKKDEIKQLRLGGAKINELAAKYKCSVGLIHKIINEK